MKRRQETFYIRGPGILLRDFFWLRSLDRSITLGEASPNLHSFRKSARRSLNKTCPANELRLSTVRATFWSHCCAGHVHTRACTDLFVLPRPTWGSSSKRAELLGSHAQHTDSACHSDGRRLTAVAEIASRPEHQTKPGFTRFSPPIPIGLGPYLVKWFRYYSDPNVHRQQRSHS
jgi:hypothetical protein